MEQAGLRILLSTNRLYLVVEHHFVLGCTTSGKASAVSRQRAVYVQKRCEIYSGAKPAGRRLQAPGVAGPCERSVRWWGDAGPGEDPRGAVVGRLYSRVAWKASAASACQSCWSVVAGGGAGATSNYWRPPRGGAVRLQAANLSHSRGGRHWLSSDLSPSGQSGTPLHLSDKSIHRPASHCHWSRRQTGTGAGGAGRHQSTPLRRLPVT